MSEQLCEGERVRVIRADRLHGHGVGETGRVVWIAPRAGPADGVVFIDCEMDKTGPGYLASFYPDEIERVP